MQFDPRIPDQITSVDLAFRGAEVQFDPRILDLIVILRGFEVRRSAHQQCFFDVRVAPKFA